MLFLTFLFAIVVAPVVKSVVITKTNPSLRSFESDAISDMAAAQINPTVKLSLTPSTSFPSRRPSSAPSTKVTAAPSAKVTAAPSAKVTAAPSAKVTAAPSAKVTAAPSAKVTAAPSAKVTAAPSAKVTAAPSSSVSVIPSIQLSTQPSSFPTSMPSVSLSTVPLGSASAFAILSKSGITDVPASAVVGDVGSSPITGASIGISCTEVTGVVYAVDAAGPSPCSVESPSTLSSNIGDMMTAYTYAAGLSDPDFLDLGAGSIGGFTLTSGLYNWGTSLLISTDIVLSGNSSSIFVFQVNGLLTVSSGAQVLLEGQVKPANVFWQVTEAVTLGTTSVMYGTILGKTSIDLLTGAVITGRLLAQTAVGLQQNQVTVSL